MILILALFSLLLFASTLSPCFVNKICLSDLTNTQILFVLRIRATATTVNIVFEYFPYSTVL